MEIMERTKAKEYYLSENITLEIFKEKGASAPYKQLVELQMKQMGRKLPAVINEEIKVFTVNEKPIIEELIDRVNDIALDKEFWTKDCNSALNIIVTTCRILIGRAKMEEPEDWFLYHVFHLITMNFACMAYEQKGFRQHIGIKKGFFS